ncbi:hypothetical protein [Undibacterium sp. TS12]|uniref:hypothetical protein n=1 Tax=Undibacterium sp. TS12 TaxID=2908202 RepID=UPI001F4D0848|nr:hypothetical protein [Undibacterium sp. TS12]MCH8617771.1 hypothetical protein [Undibacterium sp. TS12]
MPYRAVWTGVRFEKEYAALKTFLETGKINVIKSLKQFYKHNFQLILTFVNDDFDLNVFTEQAIGHTAGIEITAIVCFNAAALRLINIPACLSL